MMPNGNSASNGTGMMCPGDVRRVNLFRLSSTLDQFRSPDLQLFIPNEDEIECDVVLTSVGTFAGGRSNKKAFQQGSARLMIQRALLLAG